MSASILPFEIRTELADRRGNLRFIACCEGTDLAVEVYSPGNGEKRNKVATKWASDGRLRNGHPLDRKEISAALERAELDAIPFIEAALAPHDDGPELQIVRAASYTSDALIAELAWNTETGRPDFIVLDRHDGRVWRSDRVDISPSTGLVPPECCDGVVTPGGSMPGSVLLPTEVDETGEDEGRLRLDLRTFIDRYVELPGDAAALAVNYVLLTWLYDSFDELPYLAFRTADAGRGKSRALETVGALCYRPILCGGGSTAAATLRLLHHFGGTLIADEFDQRDTELAAEITKIINQGFQRNRPLVRCDGEQNTPTAFRCFGPKIFALRKGFADDATESRIISIKMVQRTRSDIPLTLPREEFDREALCLRNRLLALRFARLGQVRANPDHADPRLEDRLNQIGLPIMAVAGTEKRRDVILEALLQQQGRVAADRADSVPGEVFATLLDIGEPDGQVSPGDVAKAVNRNRAVTMGVEEDRLPKTERITPNKVGWIMKTVLELPRERDRNGTSYRLDPERQEQLRCRFGFSSPSAAAAAETLPSLPHCHVDELETPLITPADAENNAGGKRGNCGNVTNMVHEAHIELTAEVRDDLARIRNLDLRAAYSKPDHVAWEVWARTLEDRANRTDDPWQRERLLAGAEAAGRGEAPIADPTGGETR